jgi:hypothetical protein
MLTNATAGLVTKKQATPRAQQPTKTAFIPGPSDSNKATPTEQKLIAEVMAGHSEFLMTT